MRKLALLVAALVAAVGAPSAFGHNAGHIILPDGSCLEVGSNKEGPFVPEQNPNQNTTTDPGRLDLIPGPGDQYGARFAANQGNTPILPGNCPA
jgi:hypothetical protein